ncbi:MAG: hypothetical protein M3Q47_15160 [Actinomycetota bacterium]|nr:hypothetical protein [Actinomycetota bacterium]
MSSYRDVPVLDPRYLAKLGYDPTVHLYWYEVWEGPELISTDLDVRTLIELVRMTWGYVDWDEAADLARKLRDEAAWVALAKQFDPATRYLARVLA